MSSGAHLESQGHISDDAPQHFPAKAALICQTLHGPISQYCAMNFGVKNGGDRGQGWAPPGF